MKSIRTLLVAGLVLLAAAFTAEAQNIDFTDAQHLTLVGQLFPGSEHPYQRIDPEKYSGFSESETRQVNQCAGIAVAFTTDSPHIWARVSGIKIGMGGSTGPRGKSGLDLYIKDDDGNWRWAGGCSLKEDGDVLALLYGNSHPYSECIVYLPLFTSIQSLEIGVVPGKSLNPYPQVFKHRIAVFGSSYTHGYGCSVPSMTWTAQLSRMTGLQFINLGCSGNSKLQQRFAQALSDAPVDAYVFDAFSNPTPAEIRERLFPFIETIQRKNPGKPLIFLQTIYREWRFANGGTEEKEAAKIKTAAEMMQKACEKYKDVYYVTTTNASGELHATTDGTHPGDYGYYLWAASVKDPVTEILAKYGIQ